MTYSDSQFMRAMGIEPCGLSDPFSIPLWEQEPELDAKPPKTFREYLVQFPNGIREAVTIAAKELELTLSHDELDDLAQDVIVMFLDFTVDVEDIIEGYSLSPSSSPGECRSEHFNNYIRIEVTLGVQTLVEHGLPSRRNWRSPLDF